MDLEGKIIVPFNEPEQAMMAYKQHWQVEKALKSSGFNTEATHVADQKRLEWLFLLTMITFIWGYRIGNYLDQHIQKIKLKNHGRSAINVLKYGLY